MLHSFFIYIFLMFTAFMLCYTQDDASAEGGMYIFKIILLNVLFTLKIHIIITISIWVFSLCAFCFQYNNNRNNLFFFYIKQKKSILNHTLDNKPYKILIKNNE